MVEEESGRQKERDEQDLIDAGEREKAVRDFSTSFWVEAGAGTGKTSLLVDRLFHVVVENNTPLEQVAAITFTEKAAAELKTRLRERLEKEKESSIPEPRLQTIRRALEEIEYAFIGTIHSFAANLLQDRPVEAGVDPRFQIVDQDEISSLLEEAWEKWFDRELEKERESLRRAVKLGFPPENFYQAAHRLYHQRDILQEGEPEPCEFYPQRRLEELWEKARLLEGLLPRCKDKTDQGWEQASRFLSWLEKAEGLKEEDLVYFFLHLMPTVKAKGNQKNWHSREACAEQKEICREVEKLQEEIRKEAAGTVSREVISWLEGFFDFLEEEKADRGVLDFNDLLLRARNLLRDDLPTRGYFQKRYRCLLVDEFQDTDPLQAEIVLFLAEKEPRAAQWNQVVVEPGKLFLVGDPKQSIYRFRRADIQMYEEVRRCLHNQGEELAIVQNFRTVPAIIEWVNLAFSHLVKPEPDRTYQPEYISLHPYRDNPPGEHLRFYSPPEEWQKLRAEDLRRREARWVAALIKSEVESSRVEQEGGKNSAGGNNNSNRLKGAGRLGYGDIAVLFPTTTGIHFYEEALREMGVPYRLEGGRRFFKRKEINDFSVLVTSLDNPYDQVALVAVLRHVFGISDEELLQYAHSGGEFNYLEAGEEVKEFDGISRAFEFLREQYRRREEKPVSVFLEKLLDESGMMSVYLVQQQGHRARLNLRKAVDMARAWEKKEALTLRRYVHWLKDAFFRGKEEPESQAPGEDAVTLMTIHGSKGLEFPAVILANLISGQVRAPGVVADHYHRRFEVELGGGFATYGFSDLKDDEKVRQEAEKRRLFYVAATRARDRLLVPLTAGRSWGFWKYLEQLGREGLIPESNCYPMEELERQYLRLRADPEDRVKSSDISGEVGESIVKGGEETGGLSPDENEKEREARLRELKEQRRRWEEELGRAVSEASSALPLVSASALVEEAERTDSFPEATGRPSTEDGSPPAGGAGVGSAFHQVMEKISLQPGEEETKKLVEEASLYWGLEREEEAELQRLVRQTLRSTLWNRMQAGRVYREVPFSVQHRERLLEGLVDVIIEESGGLVIVDYKTDRVTEEEVGERVEHYRTQAYVYALAVQQVTGGRVKEAGYFFVRPGCWKTISIPSTPELEDYLKLRCS